MTHAHRATWPAVGLIVLMLMLVLLTSSTGAEPNKAARRAQRKEARCRRWKSGVCTPTSGTCGVGVQVDMRKGTSCDVNRREVPCTVPCTTASTTNAARKKLNERQKMKRRRKKQRRRNRKNNGMTRVGGKKGKKGKNISKPPKGCLYDKGAWQGCDSSTNVKNRTFTLKPTQHTQQAHCPQTYVISKACGRASGRRKGRPSRDRKNRQGRTGGAGVDCKYSRGQWTDCDAQTHTRNRTLTLKKGSAQCEQTKVRTRKCVVRAACKYSKGKWGECDVTSNEKKRIDLLKKGGSTCEKTRTLTKKCKDCQYTVSAWSACANGKRTRTRTLKHGDAATCKPPKVFTKNCANRKGEENCFYGDWGPFGSCQNGVMTRMRPVVSGGEKCQRKAVKTRSCKG